MSTLNWATPEGTIGNALIGIPVSIPVMAVDQSNFGANISYTLISGPLPPGMSLNSSTGVISGTPIYTDETGTYFYSLNYNLVIQAKVVGTTTSITGRFKIIISNTVNSDFAWVTTAGNLGTVPNGDFYSLPLEAESTRGVGVTYKLISGQLPVGMEVTTGYAVNILNIALNQTFSYIDVYHYTNSSNYGNESVKKTFTNGVVITTTANHKINSRQIVRLRNIVGTTELNGQQYYALYLSDTKFALFEDFDLQNPVVSTGLGAYTSGGVVWDHGYLQGVPVITDTVAVDSSQTYRFSIRASTTTRQVNDRAFSLTVTNVFGPVIEPSATDDYFLGSYFDGTYYSQQLTVPELNPNVQIQWELSSGELPPGLILDSNGLISGYLQPLQLVGEFGPDGYDGDTETSGIVTAKQEYDYGPYDFNNVNQNKAYSFTIRAYDGANYDIQQYTLNVVSRSGFTADNDTPGGINDTYITVDRYSSYVPVILNTSTILPTARQNGYYAFKIEGYDFQGDTITYSLSSSEGTFDNSVLDPDDNTIKGFDFEPFDSYDPGNSSTTNLPGLLLDADSGWLYGKISPQTEAIKTYKFGVIVSKVKDEITIASDPLFFTLNILGDINDTVQWVSPENLGTINNGSVSELFVEARSTEGKEIVYSLVDLTGVPCRLPQGLTLLDTGELSGRVSFETFSLDDFATTIDNNTLTIDRTYTFVVKAETADGTVSSTREFTLKLNLIDQEPYNNLYLQALPEFDQRQIYKSVIENTEIFDPNLIYRHNDPYYGLQKDIKMLFLPGLSAKDLNDYENAIVRNHYFKTYNFGDIKTAVVLDNFYNVKYEVVYIEMLDPSDESSPNLSINLADTIANPYIDDAGNEYTVVYPNSSVNMIARLENTIGYQDQSSLPSWMTSNQPSSATGKFNPPLGFTKAVVMAYTVPGAGKLIAYRLKNSGINFNNIKFTVDRYQVDNYYSTNYDYPTGRFLGGLETTFDTLPSNVGLLVASVNYGVTVPFKEINGRTLEYINSNGGIDGKTTFQDGETLIFLKQENFNNPGPYDGWVSYTDAYIGDNILTTDTEGLDSESYDTYTVVPGYLDKISGIAPINQRGGIWKIKIQNGIVILEFVQEIETNDRVQIINGSNYASAIVFYSRNLTVGQSVPFYEIFGVRPSTSTIRRTTFNDNTTRFFSRRDQYYVPGTQDKYLKFPQDGVFK